MKKRFSEEQIVRILGEAAGHGQGLAPPIAGRGLQ